MQFGEGRRLTLTMSACHKSLPNWSLYYKENFQFNGNKTKMALQLLMCCGTSERNEDALKLWQQQFPVLLATTH